MAELDVALEVGGLSMEVDAAIKTATAGLSKVVREMLKEEREYQRVGPVSVQLRGSAQANAAGVAAFGLGGPAVGRVWEVRRLIIGGLTWATVAAGSVQIYVTSVPASIDAAALNLADMADQNPALPSKGFYGSGEITLRNPQELKVVIIGATAGQQYVANGGAVDLPDNPGTRRTVGE